MRHYIFFLCISFYGFCDESFFKVEEFKISLEQIEAKGTLSEFPAHLLHPTLETGFIKGTFEVSGSLASPSLKIDMAFSELSVQNGILKKLSPFSGNCLLNLKENSCDFIGTLKNSTIETISFNGKAPVSFSLFPFAFKIDEEFSLASFISWEGEMAPLIELFKGDNANLTGFAKVLLAVTGSLNDLRIKGNAEVSNATFEIPETGSLYKNIEAKLELHENEVVLKELTATDAFQGLIKGRGGLTLSSAKNFPFAFDIEIEETKLLRLDYASATGNGQLKLTGDFTSALLFGKVVAKEAFVAIPEESSAVVQSVEVTYLNQAKDRLPPTIYEPYVSTWPIYLDLDFEVEKPFSITGTGLSSKWQGALKVKGTSYNPELFGEFKLMHGQYHFRGKAFEINKGTISFAGDPAKKSFLYVIGSQEAGDILAEAILKGTIKAPALSFRSNPPLPQREILSWILFGHGQKELSSMEDSELNQSIKDLSGHSSCGTDFLTKIRNTIGIDTLDINYNKEKTGQDVSIKMGKYISRGILISVNKGINSEANSLAVEAKLFKDLKLQAEVSDDETGHLNLKWKTDY
ncbi:MAG TPA: translocation/assembly module TamB domain-containing protein [Parachlamydiaceae bacterium]|nr:translocation/assembly module TamB domain-containing protein [Parachlamydiaceae bacterium]